MHSIDFLLFHLLDSMVAERQNRLHSHDLLISEESG